MKQILMIALNADTARVKYLLPIATGFSFMTFNPRVDKDSKKDVCN